MNQEGPTLDFLDRCWKHVEDEIDLQKTMDLMEALPHILPSLDGAEPFLLTPDQISIVTRALAVVVSEILYRQQQREEI